MTEKAKASEIDFYNLGFGYMNLPYRYRAWYKDGAWQKGELTSDNTFPISEAAAVLHYGQEIFEGLKAYRRKDGGINLFRPEENGKRLNKSAERLLMPEYPVDDFVAAIKETVAANHEFVPPYDSGAVLYIRPFVIGTGEVVGVTPADEYLFEVYVTPVGPYYKGGLTPSAFVTSDFDRAAHGGTGAAKAGGNYAASLLPGKIAKSQGYADVVYLDPLQHQYIEELGSANFFGITKDGQFQTPKSPSILPSITKYSLLQIADEQGLNPVETQISIDDIDQFAEVGAMGTAAVISPVGSITHQDQKHVFYSETAVGPLTQKLYDRLVGIQYGDSEDTYNWTVDVPVK